MRLWWIWFKRSRAWYFLPVVVGALFVDKAVDPNAMVLREWRWTSVEAGAYLFFGGAIIAGASAFESWLTHKRLSAFGSGLPVARRLMLPVWVGAVSWWVSAHLAILIGHLLPAALSDAVGTISLLAVVLQFAAVAGYVSLGVLIGWLIPHPATAPALSLAMLAANFSSGLLPADLSLKQLAWFGSVRSLVGLDLEPRLVLWRLLFFLGLLACAIAIWRSTILRRAILVVGVSTSLLGLYLTVTYRGSDLVELSSASLECVDTPGGRVVCMVPEWGHHRTKAAKSVDKVVRRAEQLGLKPPARFEVRSPAGSRVPPEGVGLILPEGDRSNGATWDEAAVDGVAIPYWCESIVEARPGEGATAWAMTATLSDWLLHRLDLRRADPAAVDLSDPLRTLDEKAQLEWVRTVYPKLWSCRVDDLPAPRGLHDLFAGTRAR